MPPEPPRSSAADGSCYRIVVESAEQAAELIRDKFGQSAEVLSVRSVPRPGWTRLVAKPRLEVVIKVPAAPPPPPADDEPRDVEPLPRPTTPPFAGTEAGPTRHLRLAELLRRTGFSELFLARLGAIQGRGNLEDEPLHQALVHVGDALRRHAASRPARPLPARAAFFGPAGAGRSTALCKWVAAQVCRRRLRGRVVKVEFDRPNPTDQLAVFCEALGVPFDHYPVTLGPAAADGFTGLDLPAISTRSPAENANLARFFGAEGIKGRVLVLNAAYDPAVLRDAYAAGRDLGATHLVFTHLDELTQWGKLWDYLLTDQLEPLFLSTGPSLTGDCEDDVYGALQRRTLPGFTPAAAEPPAPRAPERGFVAACVR